MPMQQGTLVFALFIIALAVAPVCGAEISRAVVRGENNTSVVTLTVTGGSVLGVTETLPAGSAVISCSLPPEQCRVSAGSIHLAVIGEKEVSYVIQGADGGPGTGTWTDLSDGSQGTVLGAGQSQPLPGERAPPVTPAATQAPGAGLLAAAGALGILVIFGRFRP